MANIPTSHEYKQMIKALRVQRDALDKQIGALETAIVALESVEGTLKPKRKPRERSEDTKKLEEYVQNVFRSKGTPSMKLIEVIRAVVPMYPETERPSNEDDMRGKFHNLKKLGVITSEGVPYGHIKLTKGVRAKKSEISGENGL